MASFSSFRHPSLPEPAGARHLAAALSSRWPSCSRRSKVRVSGTGVVLPLRTLLLGMFAVDAYCLGKGRETGVGHAGHIGGALFGLAYATGRKAMGCWNL
ncbi:hypothetical protein C8034_v006900 [Colletotrichum sidae]|uniref:Peptidase S54 rhomboid domain-containing protein n=1 Tax=Colletotrichum sidae TaxID=1347389 RepID=A0A4R8T9E6_9PEZI|nr:hypothetical protein C8034_v006900 [Colletotrichum sidae]